jgi:hypothetical protein
MLTPGFSTPTFDTAPVPSAIAQPTMKMAATIDKNTSMPVITRF